MINKILFFKTIVLSSLFINTSSFANSSIDKISYSLGYEIIAQTPKEMKLEAFVEGIRDAYNKKTSKYSDEELKKAIEEYQKIEAQQNEAEAQKNLKLSNEFLKQNALKPEIKITKSGLQYRITQLGAGQSPKANSEVRVNYKGMLVNGTVFDSSYDRGEAIEFPLDQVIEGWAEGLQLIKEGGKITLYIPPKLAYGDDGVPNNIPPNSVLIFDVELLKVL